MPRVIPAATPCIQAATPRAQTAAPCILAATPCAQARPEAAAALALLLFGDPEAQMPGGYSNQESSHS